MKFNENVATIAFVMIMSMSMSFLAGYGLKALEIAGR